MVINEGDKFSSVNTKWPKLPVNLFKTYFTGSWFSPDLVQWAMTISLNLNDLGMKSVQWNARLLAAFLFRFHFENLTKFFNQFRVLRKHHFLITKSANFVSYGESYNLWQCNCGSSFSHKWAASHFAIPMFNTWFLSHHVTLRLRHNSLWLRYRDESREWWEQRTQTNTNMW